MSDTLKQLHQELQKDEQNKEKILSLIEQAKLEDRSLSQTIKIEIRNYESTADHTILGSILEYTKKEIVKDLINAVLLNSDIDIKAKARKDADGSTFLVLLC